jgi:hypothetical protein
MITYQNTPGEADSWDVFQNGNLIGRVVYDTYNEVWRQSGDEYIKEYGLREDATFELAHGIV